MTERPGMTEKVDDGRHRGKLDGGKPKTVRGESAPIG